MGMEDDDPSLALVGVGAEGRAGRGELLEEGPEEGAARGRVGEDRGGVEEVGSARAMSECLAMVTLVLRRWETMCRRVVGGAEAGCRRALGSDSSSSMLKFSRFFARYS